MSVHFSSDRDDWATPQAFFDKLNDEFNFTLDPCCTHESAKCEKHYTVEDDGLSKSWSGETVFMNPPYGREIGRWMEKAHMEASAGALVVCLVPSRTDTEWWHEHAMCADEVRFVRGRLKFGDGANSAPFPSAVVVFKPFATPELLLYSYTKTIGYERT